MNLEIMSCIFMSIEKYINVHMNMDVRAPRRGWPRPYLIIFHSLTRTLHLSTFLSFSLSLQVLDSLTPAFIDSVRDSGVCERDRDRDRDRDRETETERQRQRDREWLTSHESEAADWLS